MVPLQEFLIVLLSRNYFNELQFWNLISFFGTAFQKCQVELQWKSVQKFGTSPSFLKFRGTSWNFFEISGNFLCMKYCLKFIFTKNVKD